MDHNHGKRSVPSEASEEKDEDPFFLVYPAAQSQGNTSAGVSAFAHQDIDSSNNLPPHGQESRSVSSESGMRMRQHGLFQPIQDQGKTTKALC